MSSLLQFNGDISRKGVGLEFIHVLAPPNQPDAPWYLCSDAERVPCPACECDHARIHVAYRKPRGMMGHWVLFQFNGRLQAPDLSVPISVTKLPRDAKPLSDSDNCRAWHRN